VVASFVVSYDAGYSQVVVFDGVVRCALSGFLWCCFLRDGFIHRLVGSMV
jgi:hypothetical protein